MSRLSSVKIEDFKLLLREAQKSHIAKNEPIPELGDDLSKIESSLRTPFQTFSGRDLYKGFEKKAAMLFYLLIKNHPLANGNKRMACITLAFFAAKNNRKLEIPSEVFYSMAKETAASTNKETALSSIEEIISKYLKR